MGAGFKKFPFNWRARVFKELKGIRLAVWMYHYLRSGKDDTVETSLSQLTADLPYSKSEIVKCRGQLRKAGWLIAERETYRDENGRWIVPTFKAVIPETTTTFAASRKSVSGKDATGTVAVFPVAVKAAISVDTEEIPVDTGGSGATRLRVNTERKSVSQTVSMMPSASHSSNKILKPKTKPELLDIEEQGLDVAYTESASSIPEEFVSSVPSESICAVRSEEEASPDSAASPPEEIECVTRFGTLLCKFLNIEWNDSYNKELLSLLNKFSEVELNAVLISNTIRKKFWMQDLSSVRQFVWRMMSDGEDSLPAQVRQEQNIERELMRTELNAKWKNYSDSGFKNKKYELQRSEFLFMLADTWFGFGWHDSTRFPDTESIEGFGALLDEGITSPNVEEVVGWGWSNGHQDWIKANLFRTPAGFVENFLTLCDLFSEEYERAHSQQTMEN